MIRVIVLGMVLLFLTSCSGTTNRRPWWMPGRWGSEDPTGDQPVEEVQP